MGEGVAPHIETVQPSIPVESYLGTYMTALDLCLQGLISPSTLGIDVKKLDNADAQREKEKATLYTRNSIVATLQSTLPKLIDSIFKAYDTGEAEQEQVILSAIRKGYTASRPKNTQNAEFFRMNKRKMNALVTETQKSMTKATAAALRMANDQYRSIIFGAQVFYNSGAGTLGQGVDMASKRFRQAGINCIEYCNGRRVNIGSYAEMALRTANTPPDHMAEGRTGASL